MSDTITVRGIVRTYLEKHCYDGLYSDSECACRLDDLMPCDGEGIDQCSAGHLVPCDRECDDPSCCTGHIVEGPRP
jgi:hypothetical protein